MIRRSPFRWGLAAIVVLAVAGFVAWHGRGGNVATAAQLLGAERHPQTSWGACNANANNSKASTFRPLSDAAAAALVTPETETRPYNGRSYTINGHRYQAPNDYVPTVAQIAAFRRAKGSTGQTNLQFNPYYQYVDGRDGMRNPSTDDLIQWAAHKWSIPENWLRAEYVHESYWNQFMLGDATPVGVAAYRQYPSQSRVPNSTSAYQSLGITQLRWVPNRSLHWGTEPLRWLSTAFNIDYQAATLRFYYDNPQGTRSEWGDASYHPCQAWNSLGAWFSPYPWANAGQASYAHDVQKILAGRDWASATFRDWKPSSFPPGVRFR